MANAKVRNVEEGLQGHIAKFIIFVSVNMQLIFVLLPHVNVKGWTLWKWARDNLANEFLYGGTCPIEIDGKTCSTICRKFYCKKRPFQRWWTLLPFAKKMELLSKNWDRNKKKTYYLLLATSLPRSAMFVELSILEPMKKKFHHVRKCEKRLKNEMGKGHTAASWRLLCPGWPPRLRTVLLWTSSASLSSAHQPALRIQFIIFFHRKAFCQLSKIKALFYLSKKKRIF